MKQIKLLLLVVMSVVLMACGGSGDDPKDIAKSFTEAMIDGDSDKVLDFVYIPPKMQEEIDKNPQAEEMMKSGLSMMLTQFASEIEEGGGLGDITVGEPEYNDDKSKATVPVTITLKKDNKSETEDIQLIKTDDGWKVDM